MTNEEISKLMHLPFPKLAEACKDPETLATAISLAVQMGIKVGQEQAHTYYNQMFKSYNRISIGN